MPPGTPGPALKKEKSSREQRSVASIPPQPIRYRSARRLDASSADECCRDEEPSLMSDRRPGQPDPTSIASNTTSPPLLQHDSRVNAEPPAAPPSSRPSQGSTFSPEIAHLPPPVTPANWKSSETNSDYYTATWGSPYQISPSATRSARTALSEQGHSSSDINDESPDPRFGLEHLIPNRNLNDDAPDPRFVLEHLFPSRFRDLDLAQQQQQQQLGLSPLARFHSNVNYTDPVDELVTPRSRTKRWVQLPEPAELSEEDEFTGGPAVTPRSQQKRWLQLPQREEETSDTAHWWSDESTRSSEGEKQQVPADSSPSSERRRHKSRESNRTLDQQSFWEILREERSEDMSSLLASRWAETPPPADDSPFEQPQENMKNDGVHSSPEKIVDGTSLRSSRWADTPPLVDEPWFPTPRKDVHTEPVNKVGAKEELESPSKVVAKDDPENVSKVAGEEESEGVPKIEPSEERSEEAPSKDERVDALTSSAEVQVDFASPGKPQKTEAEQLPTPPEPPADDTRPEREALQVQPPPLKKSISFRGRKIHISIPRVDYVAAGLPMPLSHAEIEERNKKFEEAGYSTRGFELSHEHGDPVQVRPIWPVEEARSLQSGQTPKVTLPDLAKWRAYQDFLTEQKLAALGVSLGGPPEEPMPPQETSRQSSGQYPPLPFSPPILPGSANSMGGRPGLVRGHSHTMSVASPSSPLNGPFGHMHRHSTVTGPITLAQLQQPMQQNGIPGMQGFNPQPQFSFPGRVGSPAQLAALRQESLSRGPGSPLSQQMLTQSDFNNLVGGQGRRQHSYSQSMYQPQFQPPFQMPQNAFTFGAQGPSIRATPLLPELPEDEDEEEKEDGEVEVEVEQEPERPVTPELQAYVPPHKRAQADTEILVPTPRGHGRNISEGLERDVQEREQRHRLARDNFVEVTEEDESSEETSNERRRSSILGAKSWRKQDDPPEKDPLSQEHTVLETPHSRKKSGSRLNANAPKFTFNPQAEFKPSFGFAPAPQPAFTFGASNPVVNGFGGAHHTRNQSSGNFNAAAPAFKPVTSEFSFSATGPTHNRTPTIFDPSKSDSDTPAIFGRVEIPEIVKPARRSKAVAIVRPDEPTSHSGTDHEDEEGRLAPKGNAKKQRKADDDGDEVPQFAEPTPIVLPAEKILGSNEPALGAQNGVNEHERMADVAEEKADQVINENIPETRGTPPANELPSAEAIVQKKQHAHKHSTSLSALAKPFSPSAFTPPAMASPTINPPNKGHEHFASISELEEGEIRSDSRTASPEPPSATLFPARDLSSGATPRPTYASLQPRSEERIDTVAHVEPSFNEIDAIMQHLNAEPEEQAQAEAEEEEEPSPMPPSPGSHPMQGVTYIPEWARSDAPSPSPRRHHQPSFDLLNRADSREHFRNAWQSVNRLNKAEEVPTSDWSGILSPPDEEKLHARSSFFDSRVNTMISRIFEERLQPLEESLRSLHTSFGKRPRSDDRELKRTSSNTHSDADDEDDMQDEFKHRPLSRGRDKRVDQIKAAVLEALREQSPRRSQAALELTDLHSVLADVKGSFAKAVSDRLELDDIRAVVDDALHRQSQALVPATTVSGDSTESHHRQVSELEGRLNETLAGRLEEANLRRAAEEREVEARRLLRLAEEELSLMRDTASDEKSRLRVVEEEREDLADQLEKAARARRTAEEEREDVEDQNKALEATLQEYRTSSHRWRQDIDEGKQERDELRRELSDIKQERDDLQQDVDDGKQELDQLAQIRAAEKRERSGLQSEVDTVKSEREDLKRVVAALEHQLSENRESSGSMKRRLEKLHADMATAAGKLGTEKALWKAREEDYRARHETLEAQHAAHGRERTQLEEELRMARSAALEAPELRHSLDLLRKSNSSLEDTIRKLQGEVVEQQALATRYERQFHDAQESGRSEVHRTRMALETDIESANHQVNIVRSELESDLAKTRTELENVKMEAETARARHEHQLEQEETARREALRKVNHANSVALDEARLKYDSAVKDLQAQHARSLKHAIEDKDRSELFLNERLSLSDAKLHHFQDRVQHLEERLEVAQSAAKAAVSSVTSARPTMPSSSFASGVPEKVSPQALRESILVLQEQLQERELRIERLQTQVEEEGIAKLKERDTEIAWLRELLSVRGEELTSLISTLSRPAFDPEAVRDFAIRIRANLQMEQEEKERHGRSPQPSLSGQALASLSSFASPKLTGAFNKWRSTMESSTLKSQARPGMPGRSSTPSRSQMARRPQPASYNSGLMTPPATNLRSSPVPETTASLPPPRLHPRSGSKASDPPMQLSDPVPQPTKSRQASMTQADSGPSTPPLFREQSYDQDAEDSNAHLEPFEDDSLEEVADTEPPAFRSLEDEMGESDEPTAAPEIEV